MRRLAAFSIVIVLTRFAASLSAADGTTNADPKAAISNLMARMEQEGQRLEARRNAVLSSPASPSHSPESSMRFFPVATRRLVRDDSVGITISRSDFMVGILSRGESRSQWTQTR